jgi:hypothetical protein
MKAIVTHRMAPSFEIADPCRQEAQASIGVDLSVGAEPFLGSGIGAAGTRRLYHKYDDARKFPACNKKPRPEAGVGVGDPCQR